MMKKLAMAAVLAAAIGAIAACGGKGKLGEKCDTRGATDECEDGTICDGKAGTDPKCLKVCTDQAGCAMTEDCNGVTGSNTKACFPK